MWANVELREDGTAYNFRAYLKSKEIYYEASGCGVDNEGYKLTHFEIKASESEKAEINQWLERN